MITQANTAGRPRARATLLGASVLASLAGWSAAATAAPLACSMGALSGLIGGVTINTAATVPVSTTNPVAYCDVTGRLTTSGDGAPAGSAGFELRLPVNWNGKFLFFGVGGLAGSTYADFSANPVDYVEALGKGYATAITDEGHTAGNTDASWALTATDTPAKAALTDYYDRATHEVTVAGKALVEAYYGAPISLAYFDGCSNGGRQAMVEATHFPADYNGIIAGAPFLDIRTIIGGAKDAQALFASATSYLPATLLPAVDAAVNAACDAADGVTDGLIQNPAQCAVKPQSLVCKHGATTNCLTPDQADFLTTYISALRDDTGQLIYPGYSITNLSNGGADAWTVGEVPPTQPLGGPEPWGNDGFSPAPYGFQFVDHIIKDIVTLNPDYDTLDYPAAGGVVSRATLKQFDNRTGLGDAGSPYDYQAFIDGGGKLIWYHGLSDPALPPFRDYVLYEQLSHLVPGGYAALQKSIRLFMVPGMQHCGGGVGPNYFDTLTPLESWVEHNRAPQSIIATHYPSNVTTNPPDRTMPLCPFPATATYGSGPVDQASSWSCTANRNMLSVAYDGRLAGLAGGNNVSFPSDIAP